MTAALAIDTPRHRSLKRDDRTSNGGWPVAFGGEERSTIPFRHYGDWRARPFVLSIHQDGLTGLANRSGMEAILEGLIESGRPTGLILLDLGAFREINDILGHDGGDVLLQRVARTLSRCVEDHETVARLGNDEFGVIVPSLTCPRALARTANRYRTLLQCELQDFPVHSLRASAGAALFPLHALSRSELVGCAEIGLQASKDAGRNRVTIFRAGLRSAIVSRRREIERATECLRMDRLNVVFQPKQDLQSGQVTGYEALLRCRDSNGRNKPPSWISAAFEDPRLSHAISTFVERSGIAFLRDLCTAGRTDGRVAINVTSFELRSSNWASGLIRRLNEFSIPPSRLQVEVSESVLLGRSSGFAMRSLGTLHDAGVRISLDDFGTGFASLSHLRTCPVDELKIDRSFVENLYDPDARAIVRSIISLGRSLRMTVVAEGVENEDQHQLLKKWGCTEGQGFFYGRPSPPRHWRRPVTR